MASPHVGKKYGSVIVKFFKNGFAYKGDKNFVSLMNVYAWAINFDMINLNNYNNLVEDLF